MTDSLDITYYAPGFAIEIEGKKLEPVTQISIDFITVTKKIGQADNFRFKVVNKTDSGVSHLLDDKSFKVGNKISISIGYRPNNFLKMQGNIEVIEPKFADGEMTSFEIAGKDKALALLAEESGYKCYTKKKDSDIVKEIAGEVNLSPQVDDTSGTPPEKKEKKSGTSYLFFIKKMVTQNRDYEFFVTDGKLIFRKAKIKDSPSKELHWGKHLSSFEPKLNLSGIITGVTVKWWDEKKCEPITAQAKATDETPVGSGETAGKIAKKVYGEIEKIIADEPVDSESEAKNIAVSELCDTNKELVTAEGKTIGVPEIEPGAIIEVKGMGDLFSGKYYVSSATHTIEGGGGSTNYHTEFCVRRNTI